MPVPPLLLPLQRRQLLMLALEEQTARCGTANANATVVAAVLRVASMETPVETSADGKLFLYTL